MLAQIFTSRYIIIAVLLSFLSLIVFYYLEICHPLQAYTFPAERRCANTVFASHVYSRLVRRLLSHGTTTAVYYATIHLDATKALVDICRVSFN